MAFESGTANDVEHLMNTRLKTFLEANGWTTDHSAAGRLLVHKGTALFPSFRWATAAAVNVGIYHALGFVNSATDPGNHTDDSGQGVVSGVDATLATGRHVPLVNGAMTYFFFAQSAFVYCVVRVAANDYRHFGFGSLSKFGDGWTGGEFVYGWRWNFASADFDLLAVRTDSSTMLDALGTEQAFAASVHMEGIPNQAVGKWGVVGALASAGTDRGATARTKVFGGFRGGAMRYYPWQSNNATGLVPLSSIQCYAETNSAADIYLLGTMSDVRAVDLSFFSAEDEILIGADTFKLFPTKARGAYDGITQTTVKQGIAYKKA